MHQLSLLKSLINNEDITLEQVNSIEKKSDILFPDENNSELFHLIKSYFVKYNKTPSDNYLSTLFQTEKDNKAKVAFKEIKSDPEIEDHKADILGLMDIQFQFSIKKRMMEEQKRFDDDMKKANLSEIPELIINHTTKISEVSRRLGGDNKKVHTMMGDDAIEDIKAHYEILKEKGYIVANTEIKHIDAIWGGVQRDDMLTIGGYTGQGKSTLARYMTYLQTLNGRNSVYITTEMTSESVRAYFLSMHANNRKIWGFGKPSITTKAILSGNFTDEQSDFFFNEVIPDFMHNPDYGILKIIEPDTYDSTIYDTLNEVQSIHKSEFPIHFLAWDYLTNMRPNRKVSHDQRQEYNKAISDARRFFLNMEVPWVACAQVSRGGYNEYLKTGVYSIDALSDYNEFDRCLDLETKVFVKINDKEKLINIGDIELLINENKLEIMSEFGWIPILNYYDNGEKETITLHFDNGRSITCTPDHPIKTKNRGWVQAQHLSDDDEFFSDFSEF